MLYVPCPVQDQFSRLLGFCPSGRSREDTDVDEVAQLTGVWTYSCGP